MLIYSSAALPLTSLFNGGVCKNSDSLVRSPDSVAESESLRMEPRGHILLKHHDGGLCYIPS